MPPEFIVPGEQGVPFGSGFQIGPQATEANSSEQATSSFIIGTKGIVAYTAFIEEGEQMVLLEVDCTLYCRNHFCSLARVCCTRRRTPGVCHDQCSFFNTVRKRACLWPSNPQGQTLCRWGTSGFGVMPQHSRRFLWSAKLRIQIIPSSRSTSCEVRARSATGRKRNAPRRTLGILLSALQG